MDLKEYLGLVFYEVNKIDGWITLDLKINLKQIFMKKLLAIMALSVGLLANAQTVDLLKPAKDIVLRAPSVPIIVSDPYFRSGHPMIN